MITSHSSGTSEVFWFCFLKFTFHFYTYKATKCFGTAFYNGFMTICDNNRLKISIIQYKFLTLSCLREKSQIEKRYCFYLWKTKSGKFGRRVKRQRRSSCRIYLQGCPCCILRFTIWRGFFVTFHFYEGFSRACFSMIKW